MAYINQQLQNECYAQAEYITKIYTDKNITPPLTVVEMATQLYQTIIEMNRKKEIEQDGHN
jgi:hypothetical protein